MKWQANFIAHLLDPDGTKLNEKARFKMSSAGERAMYAAGTREHEEMCKVYVNGYHWCIPFETWRNADKENNGEISK